MTDTFKPLEFDVAGLRAKMDARAVEACQHQNVRVVWTSWSSHGERYCGGRQLRKFCDDCGWLLPNAVKRALATPDTPEISLEEVTRGSRLREEEWKREQAEFEAGKEQRRAEYQKYLQTGDWWERRSLVMQRANWICEGCRNAPAEETHHLTYKHCGNEFPF